MQIQTYMLCFILGFLLTALPRMTSSTPVTSAELCIFLLLLVLQVVCLSLGYWIGAQLCFAILLAAVAHFVYVRCAQRAQAQGSGPPMEFVWISIALIHGWTACALLVLGQLEIVPRWCLGIGRPMLQQGFLIALVLGVGGFLGARLLGRGIPPAAVDGSHELVQRWRQRRLCVHLACGALLFGSFVLEGCGTPYWAYVLRAVVITLQLRITLQYPALPRVRDAYVLLLWASFGMLIIGSWLVVACFTYRVAMLHIVFLGGFSAMTFAVGIMVTLSHSDAAQRLREPLPILTLIGCSIVGAIFLRVLAPFLPAHYFGLLAWAALCWIIAGTGWLAYLWPYLALLPTGDSFAGAHAAAKARMRGTKRHP